MLLRLQRLQLDAPLNHSGECLVLTELVLPRNAIQSKSALKPIRLSKGRRSLARAPLYETGLLKEKVDGCFGLTVAVTRPLARPEFHRFLRRLLATGIEGLARVDLPGLSGLPARLLGDLADETGDALADRISAAPAFLASGGLDLDSEALESGSLSIPLKLHETLRSSDALKPSEKREKRRSSAITYRKGSTVGEVVLAVEA